VPQALEITKLYRDSPLSIANDADMNWQCCVHCKPCKFRMAASRRCYCATTNLTPISICIHQLAPPNVPN